MRNIKILLFFIVFISLQSCSKSDTKDKFIPSSGPAKIAVNLKDIVFETSSELINQPSSRTAMGDMDEHVHRNTVVLSKDFYLVSELSADLSTPEERIAIAATKKRKGIGAIEQDPLTQNIRYKIAIFAQDGIFVKEQDFIRGSENLSPLELDGGSTYSFIVYSINSTATVPPLVFVNINNRTLSTASVNTSGVTDFMYFRKDLTVSGETVNFLDVILKHQFSQITTTVDATATGYNITAIASNFGPHLPQAKVNLADASIERSGTPGTSAVTFSTPNAQIVTSLPTIINAATNASTIYTISSLTVGPLNRTNLVPFTNLALTPGVKYDLKLNIVPTDEFLTHQGIPAARINGKIWMRHNLGVNTTIDPDILPMTSNRHGNYYQWGRINSVASGTANTMPGANLNVGPPNTTWNVLESNPAKTAADPCPAGYRIPTRTEMQQLLTDVVATSNGVYTNSRTNFGSAKILTSTRKNGVKLTMPIQGYMGLSFNVNTPPFINDQGSVSRGSIGFYWNSYAIGTPPRTSDFAFSSTAASVPLEATGNEVYKAVAMPIRCISE